MENVKSNLDDIFIYVVGDEERKRFLEYKENGDRGYNNDEKLEFTILKLLDNCGFSLECVGTYLYKDVIKEIVLYIKNNKNIEVLRDKLSDPYSQFYFNLAKNERDIGVKSFHSYIKSAIDDVCLNNCYFLGDSDIDSYSKIAFDLAVFLVTFSEENELVFKRKKVLVKENTCN